MCGIVGATAKRDVAKLLVDGLKRLEYRGYDSAGISIIDSQQQLQRQRAVGKVVKLESELAKKPLKGFLGIAHTRWATHGSVTQENAHPQVSHHNIAVVHNGIIENFTELKQALLEAGYRFQSDTDTEIIAHLYHQLFQQSHDTLQALLSLAERLKGAFALGIVNAEFPDTILALRRGSPLIIGKGKDENFIASDHFALLPETKEFIYLEEGDIAFLTQEKVSIYDSSGKLATRKTVTLTAEYDDADKGDYEHFMQKEIHAQPEAVMATLGGRLSESRVLPEIFGQHAVGIFEKVKRIQIVACGTSYHAGMVAKYWLESIAGVPCNVEIASEFRYRQVFVEPDTLFVTISQSGETADTLAALRAAKEMGYLSILAICNVPESSLVRESDLVFMTRAGIEIGVASTKAFTTQLTALLMLTMVVGHYHKLTSEQEKIYIEQLRQLPALLQCVLKLDSKIAAVAKHFTDKHHALFLGRGAHYPIALEGALKLKEISYIHAEGYPAGELKHGPLALVDHAMPVIAVAPNDALLEKLKSNLQEVRARGGKLYVFADSDAKIEKSDELHVIEMPVVANLIAPIVYTLPLQLLAYHVALLKGTDVDQPRNLAKSVTVE